jgi:flagellar biosynthesis protein FlhG
MIDQASKLRSLMGANVPAVEAAGGGAPMIVVSGARGGVGATSAAMNLAAVLSDQGERVLLVDGAQQRNELIETSGVRRELEFSLADVLSGKCRIEEALVGGPLGMQMLVNRWSARTSPDFSRTAQQRLMSELQSLDGSVDLVIVDAGRGLSAWSRRFWSRADLILVVATADDAGILDAYATVKQGVADASGLPLRLVINKAESDTAADEAQRRLDACCRRFLSRALPALPALPLHVAVDFVHMHSAPRVWEMPNTAFGHAALWLGRAVAEVLDGDAGCGMLGAGKMELSGFVAEGMGSGR